MVLKISVFFLAVMVSNVFATSTYAQETKMTFDMENASVEQVIDAIEAQTEFYFLFNQKYIDIDRKVNVSLENGLIEDALAEIFHGTDVNFRIIDRQILLSLDELSENVVNPAIASTLTTNATRLQSSVTGMVTDASTGEALIGVNIVEEGTRNGVISDASGEYSIQVSNADAFLLFSYIGYKTERIGVAGRETVNVTLIPDINSMEEVIVIGYGTVKKSDLTGSISSIRSKDMDMTGNVSVGQLLAGRAAGLQVNQYSAQPGGGIEFLIRGQAGGGAGNAPLIVVDGFPITDFYEPSEPNRSNYGDYGSRSPLNSLDPNDIESIEVLKDASATAIYGARAGHGVILITTKRGQSGKTKITYSGSTSFQQLSNDYNMLNATDFMIQTNRYEKERWLMKYKLGVYGPEGVGLTEEEYLAQPGKKPYSPIYSEREIDSIPGTDWLSQITRTGVIKQNNIGITGGTDATRYMISLSSFDQQGVIINTDIKRYSGRINLDQRLNEKLTTGINLSFAQLSSTNAPISNSANEGSGLIRSALHFNPTLPVYDENGNFSVMPSLPRHANPLSLKTIQDNTITSKFTASNYIDYEVVNNLKIRLNTGVDRYVSKRSSYMPMTVPIGADEKGRASQFNSESENYLVELTANYSINKGGHNISFLGGYSYQVLKYGGSTMSQSNFITDALGYYLIGTGQMPMIGNISGSKEEIASYFSRVNYILNDKYLLTGTIRADGSSKFAENNKWGYFPSVALAWKMDQEPFMSGITDIVSTLKPRVSFGQTGNSNIGGNAFPFYGVISSGYQFGKTGFFTNEVELFQLENKDLKWETTTELNVGLDIGLFKDRINTTIEYYQRVISDLLSTRNLMSYHSLNTLAYNIGKTQSTGFELTINSRNVVKPKFYWSTDVTIFKYVDRWKERDESWKPSVFETENDYLRPYLSSQSDGLVMPGEVIPHMPNALPGQIKIMDINGLAVDDEGFPVVDENGQQVYTGAPDGKLDAADMISSGSWDPDLILGLSNSFIYKNLSLRIYLYGVLGKKLTNPLYGQYLAMKENKLGLNKVADVKDSWANDNQDSEFPSYFSVENEYGWGDFFLEDASFVRVKNITLNYKIRPKLLFNLVQEANIYIDIQNPFVFTKYTGLDPETDSYPAAYPNQITYSAGLKVTF